MNAEWKWLDDIGGALFVEGKRVASVWLVWGGWRVMVDYGNGVIREIKCIGEEQTARDIALAAYDVPIGRRYRLWLPDDVTFEGHGDVLRWFLRHQGCGLSMALAAVDAP